MTLPAAYELSRREFDPRKPLDPSGIRLGTPALTTRGMKEDAIRQVASWIVAVLEAPDDEALAARTRSEIAGFARDYPVPSDTGASEAALSATRSSVWVPQAARTRQLARAPATIA